MIFLITLTNGFQIPDESIINILYASLIGNQQLTSNITVVQYDDTIPIVGLNLLTEGSKQYIPRENDVLTVRMKKPDGHGVVNPCLGYDEDGIIYFAITQQMTAAFGMGELVAEISNTTGTKSSSTIMINISENPVKEGQIESTDEFKTLTELLVEVKNAIQLINDNENALAFIENNPQDIKNVSENSSFIKNVSDNINEVNQVGGNIQDVINASQNINEIISAPTYANEAKDSAVLSKSWAVGGTGTRDGEDTNNAKYYADTINPDSFAPKLHSSPNTTYGIGTSNNYGHIKLSDNISNQNGSSNGIASTPLAVYNYLTNYYNKNDSDSRYATAQQGNLAQTAVQPDDLDIYLKKNDLINLIYPIGSIYISVNNASPETFLGGTWEQIQGRFLLASSSAHPAGSTSGAESQTISLQQIPDHYHVVSTGDGSGAGYNYPEYAAIVSQNAGASPSNAYACNTGYVSGRSDVDQQPLSTMPPYLAVYMWKRTA